MEDDEPYDLMPHRQIADIKKQLQELKSKIDKASPQELINSMNALAKSIDAMLKLFSQAADELRFEEKEAELSSGKDSVNEKLDKIIEQNKVLADGMVAISEMIDDLAGKQKKPELRFQPAMQPNFPQTPSFEPSFDEPMPQLDQPPMPKQGPVAMPSIPFPSFEPAKPKKGLFGRLKK